MKNFSKFLLTLSVASVSAGVFAGENESMTVHFNGTVTQPTCTFTTPQKNVTLQPVKTSDMEKVAIGQATDVNSQKFKLDLHCASKAEAEHISIALAAEADATARNAIKNTADDTGVGLELFTEANQELALNGELPQPAYLDRLNEGDDNLNFIVKYARVNQDVSGGLVAGDAVFTVNYK